MLAEILSIPYTENQLSVVIIACVLIGMFFGAAMVGVLTDKKLKD